VAFFIARHESQPNLEIVFEIDKTPDKYREEKELRLYNLSNLGAGISQVKRKFWKTCVVNSGGLAEACKVTVNLLNWSSPAVRHSPQGETEVVWENGQSLHAVGAKKGREFFHVVYSDQRADKIEGDYKAFVSTLDGIQNWFAPDLRAQDALGRGEFEIEVTVTSVKDGASASKRFKVTTGLTWHDLQMEEIRERA